VTAGVARFAWSNALDDFWCVACVEKSSGGTSLVTQHNARTQRVFGNLTLNLMVMVWREKEREGERRREKEREKEREEEKQAKGERKQIDGHNHKPITQQQHMSYRDNAPSLVFMLYVRVIA
jgi:hypothetical protein